MLTASDIAGYLAAFGQPVRVKGRELLGIVENEYEQINLGERIRISSNAPYLTLEARVVDDLGIALNDVAVIPNHKDADVSYIIKEIQPDSFHEFTRLRLIESA